MSQAYRVDHTQLCGSANGAISAFCRLLLLGLKLVGWNSLEGTSIDKSLCFLRLMHDTTLFHRALISIRFTWFKGYLMLSVEGLAHDGLCLKPPVAWSHWLLLVGVIHVLNVLLMDGHMVHGHSSLFLYVILSVDNALPFRIYLSYFARSNNSPIGPLWRPCSDLPIRRKGLLVGLRLGIAIR